MYKKLATTYYCFCILWIKFQSELLSSQTCIVLPCLAQKQEELKVLKYHLYYTGLETSSQGYTHQNLNILFQCDSYYRPEIKLNFHIIIITLEKKQTNL